MAITRREQEIIALAESGLGGDEIARRLGLARGSVHAKLGILFSSLSEDTRREAMIRQATSQLGAAVAAAGGHH
jgi:DNA-binding NarL/FixJ family response regulator